MKNNHIISEKSPTFPVFPIQEGLDFILNHFQEPLWPRTISTLATNGAQITAYNREDTGDFGDIFTDDGCSPDVGQLDD